MVSYFYGAKLLKNSFSMPHPRPGNGHAQGAFMPDMPDLMPFSKLLIYFFHMGSFQKRVESGISGISQGEIN
jgi:hypothetical protein